MVRWLWMSIIQMDLENSAWADRGDKGEFCGIIWLGILTVDMWRDIQGESWSANGQSNVRKEQHAYGH